MTDPTKDPKQISERGMTKMDFSDPCAMQTIRKALQCHISGKRAKKLGVFAECLIDHGI